MVISHETLQSNSQLVQIADTLDLLRLLFGSGNCRKQKASQNCDNGNHDEQFCQRECSCRGKPDGTPLSGYFHVHVLLDTATACPSRLSPIICTP
jgi:hypothetical protein